MRKGPIKTVIISDIVAESPYGVKVVLRKSGKLLWINHDLIVNAAPGSLFVPEWYYMKKISPLENTDNDRVD